MNSQEETEQTKNDIYSDLREMAHFFGGWDELREIVKILEEEDKIASSERYFSRDI